MHVRVVKINDKKTSVPINSETHRVEEIKEKISNSKNITSNENQVEIMEMWDDLPED